MKRLLSGTVLLLLLLLPVLARPAACETRLIGLNVGKGDCLLLLTDSHAYLIDAGYEHTSNLMLEALRQYGAERLDGVFLTHCDKDHYGGLERLALSGIPVDAWYAPIIYHDVPPEGHPLENAAVTRGSSATWLNAGDVPVQNDEITIRVLGPAVLNTENENNNSLVLQAESEDGIVLLTGDMKLEEETDLLSRGVFGPVDVMKVPFHGDNTASGESFVQATAPQIALICTSSVQEPDTPASSVLKRYGRIGARVLVTQDTPQGYEIVLERGQTDARSIEWDLPDPTGTLRMRIEPEQDLLILSSLCDRDIALDGWLLFSTRGEECILLPEGAVLPAGGEYRIGSRMTDTETDLKLDVKRIWHKSKPDQAILFDVHGTAAAEADNGIKN